MSEVGPRPILSDGKIQALLSERKRLPTDWLRTLHLANPARGHYLSELEVTGEDGNRFELRLRQATRDPLAFSAILSVLDIEGLRRFRLRRYNGRSHGHRNLIERQKLPIGFHIHQATERYQLMGCREDAYAEPTDRYGNLWDAVSCLIADCGFEDDNDQMRLL